MPIVNTSDLIQEDGFSTIIEIDGVTELRFEEQEVTPPGLSAGGKINTTTMRSTGGWRTAAAKKMKSLEDMSLKVAWATAAYTVIMGVIGIPKMFTVTFPDGATLEFWAILDEFKPGAQKEGEQPTADITIVPTLKNPATGATVAPVFTDGPAI